MNTSIVTVKDPLLRCPAANIQLTQWLCACLASLLITSAPAQKAIPGQSGEATARGVVNLSEVARQEALAPPPPLPPKPRPVFRIPKRGRSSPVPNTSLSVRPKSVPESAPSGTSAPAAITPLVSSNPSPPPSASFLALEDDGRKTLPATHGAVGSNYLMVTLNSQVRIQDRSGLSITNVTLEGWWSSLNCSNVSDPHVLFDPYKQRWIFTAVGDRGVPLGLLVAVSATSDPTANWYLNFYSTAPYWSDSPTVGFNTNRIVVQVNLFDTNLAFYGSSISAFNKTNLYAGGTGQRKLFVLPDSGTGLPNDYGASQVPAVSLGSTTTTNYLVSNWNGNPDPDPDNGRIYASLRIFSISGALGSEVFNVTDSGGLDGPFAYAVDDPWESTSADDVDSLPQLGTTNQIYAGDARLVNVVLRDSTLWAAQTIFLPSGTNLPTHSAVQWWQITPGVGNVVQRGRIEDPSGNVHFAYPSMGVNQNEDVLIGYSRFSASQYPSANYSFRIGDETLGILRDDTVLKTGESSYYSPDPQFGLNFWGRWSATVVDPNNDSDLWTIQEYAAVPAGTNSHWGTWWGRISPPANLALTMTDSPDPVLVGANITYTMVVTNAMDTNVVITASGVKVTNALPAGLAFVSAVSTQGSCSYANGVVTCDLGDLRTQGKATITLVATATAVGQITNKATVFGNGPETNAVDNTAMAVTTVNPAADLAVLMSDSPDPVLLTSNLTYTVVVTNRGTSTASAVTLTNLLSSAPAVTFVSASSTQGTNSRSGTNITFTLGSLASGATATATIIVSCPNAGSVSNRAVVASTTADPIATNNSATVSTRVDATPTIQAIVNRTINEDATDSFTFTVGDAETPVANLVITANSSNPSLIPNSGLVVTGTSSPRTLTIYPLTNQSGTAVITLTVTDADGASSKTMWTETVTAVNDVPTLDQPANVPMIEDSGPFVVNLTGISSGAPNEPDTLTLTATSGNTAILPNPVITYTSPNPTATLNFNPVTNAFGSVVITVKVNDNQLANNTVTRTFTVTINPVNDPPTLTAPAPVNINEDAGLQTVSLSGIGTGAANEADTLGITASSSDPSLIPNPTVAYTSPAATGTLTFTPVPTKSGTATITVTVDDHQPSNNIVRQTFTVTVNPVNDVPTLNAISSVTVNEDVGLQTVNFNGVTSGATNEADTLTVSATSSNPGLIPDPSVSYISPNTNGSLSFTPVPTKSGSATITVTVNDNQPSNNIVTRTFTITVSPVNDPPTLDPLTDLPILEDSGQWTVNLTGITTGATNESDTLTVTAVSGTPSLIPNPTVTYTSPGNTGTLKFTPATNAFGTALITVTVNDGQPSNNIVTRTFNVTVAPVNDPPTLNTITNQVMNEDAGLQTININGISTGAANEPDVLTVTATSSNPSVIPDPTVTYTSPATNGTLKFTPVPNASGSATVTVTVNDNQPSNNVVVRTFTVTVNPVNDPPTLTPIPNLTFNEDAGPQTVPLSGITSGAANENQTLSVTVSNGSPAILTNLAVSYASPATTASLSFTTVTNANGVATITVTVNDGGLSNNTVRQSFTVTVNSVNDLPFLADIPDQVTDEDVPLTIPLTVSDVETPKASLLLTAQSSNEEVISGSGVSFVLTNGNWVAIVRPLTNAFGPSTFITVRVTDGNGAWVETFFEVVVNPVNDPPMISGLSNQTINEDAPLNLSFTVDDLETPADLTVSATSSNPALVPGNSIVLGGGGASRTLALTPVANQSGTTTIKVIATDLDGASTTNSFLLTVNSVNDPPTLDALLDVNVIEDSGLRTVNLTGITTGAANEANTLTVTAVSSNPSIIPNPTVTYTSPSSTGSLQFTPVTTKFGTVTVTVTVNDNQPSNNIITRTFNVTVAPVNDPPTLNVIGNLTLTEDSGIQSINLNGITSGATNETDTLTVTASSDNPSVVPDPTVTYTSPAVSGSLMLVPVPNAFGSATITVTVNDNQPSNNIVTRTFTVTVTPVNDPPTLNPIGSLTVMEDAGLQTVNLDGISSGAANEVQTLIVTAANSNPALLTNVAVTYTSPAASGTLTFKPVTDAIGSATITVTVNDGGSPNNIINRAFNVTVTTLTSPLLSITPGTGKVTLSWLTNAAGFNLQGRDMSDAIGWVGVTNTPIKVVNRFYVTNFVGGTSRVYRLTK